jgi:hypothetical protein
MATDRPARNAPGKTKGVAWAVMIRWYERTYGREKLLAAVALMPEPHRSALDPRHETLGILVGSWYSEVLRNHYFDALTADLTQLQKQAMARAMAYEVMNNSLRGVHRMIFNIMATPERFVKYAQTLWDVHHDTGRLRMKQLSPTSAEAAVLDWPTHHPFACMMNHYSCLATYEAMGCFDLSERRACISEGAPECVGVYYWRSRK